MILSFSVATILYIIIVWKCNTYLTAKGSFILCGLFLYQGGTVGIKIKGAFRSLNLVILRRSASFLHLLLRHSFDFRTYHGFHQALVLGGYVCGMVLNDSTMLSFCAPI